LTSSYNTKKTKKASRKKKKKKNHATEVSFKLQEASSEAKNGHPKKITISYNHQEQKAEYHRQQNTIQIYKSIEK